MEVVNTYQNNNLQATIVRSDAGFEIEFLENSKVLGTVPYYTKSIHYVESAAENFVSGILTKETIDRYKKA